jgi:hypothetical protein
MPLLYRIEKFLFDQFGVGVKNTRRVQNQTFQTCKGAVEKRKATAQMNVEEICASWETSR